MALSYWLVLSEVGEAYQALNWLNEGL